MSARATQDDRHAKAGHDVATAERAVQQGVERAERQRDGSGGGGAMQAGARRYPEPPLPGDHLAKPGNEADLSLAPMYDAPHYKGSEKLAGKVAIITGADSGIGRSAGPVVDHKRVQRICR